MKNSLGMLLAAAATGALMSASGALAAGVPIIPHSGDRPALPLETEAVPPAPAPLSDLRIEVMSGPYQNGGTGKLHQADSDSLVFVRLRRSSDGVPLTDADVALSRVDMSPGGMDGMTARSYIRPYLDLGGHPGVYRIEIHPQMAGLWRIMLAVQEVNETRPIQPTMTVYLAK